MYEQQKLIISERPSYIGMMVSLPFLFITFIVYALIPLKDGHGKILICYVSSLFGYYLFCIIADGMREQGHVSSATCITVVCLIIYFLLATFCWMNVICMDLWINICDARGYWDSVTMEKRRRYWFYSGYAWCVPLLIVILIVILSKTVQLFTWYNPGLADGSCWLNDGIPVFINLHLPTTITIVIDVVFLCLTACKIKMADEEEVTNSRKKKMCRKLYTYIEFFLILFVIWLMEIITWALTFRGVPSGFWYFMEICNAASGILIFLTVVLLNKKMMTLTLKRFQDVKTNWRNKKRYGVDEPRPTQE